MLLSNLNVLATAPGGVARLRELILTLAVQGKLVPQDPADEPASVLLQRIRAEKDRLITEGKIKRDKPLAEIAEGEKPFELPAGWEWVRLGNLAELITSGSRDWAEYYSDSGPIFVRMGNLSRGSFKLRLHNIQHVRPPSGGEGSRTSLEAGDLLLSITGEVGLLGLVPAGFGEAYINQHTCLIRWVNCLRTEYLPTQLLSAFVQSQFNSPQRGIKNSFRLSDVSGILLALPPLAEQARIVARVEELMRLCDALEAKGRLEAAQHAQLVSTLLGTLTDSGTPEALAANWQRVAAHFDLLLDRPEAVDALEQTLLQLAVRGLLVPQDPSDEPASALLQRIRAEKDRLIAEGKVKRDKVLAEIADVDRTLKLPQGWAWQTLAEIGTWAIGSGFPHDAQGRTGLPILFAKVSDMNLPGNELNIVRTNHTIDEETAERLRVNVHPAGTVIFPKIGGAIATNKRRVLVQPTAIDNNCLGVTPSNAIRTSYLFLLLSSIDFTKYQAGTSVPALSQGSLGKIPVGLPPLAEQARIVARVEALRRLCAELRQRLVASQTAQAQLAEALVAGMAA